MSALAVAATGDETDDGGEVQPVGPSPVIIHMPQLKKVAKRWLEYSYILRGNPEPARIIQDWVLEMWGWSIAAASKT